MIKSIVKFKEKNHDFANLKTSSEFLFIFPENVTLILRVFKKAFNIKKSYNRTFK